MTAKVVGLLALRLTELIELERLASALRDSGDFRPIFFVHRGSPVFLANQSRLESGAMPFSFINPGIGTAISYRGSIRRLGRWMDAGGVLSHYWAQTDQIHEATSILDKLRASLLVVGEDGVGADNATIAACRRLGVPVLVLPYEYSTVDQPLRYIRTTPDLLQRCTVRTVAQKMLGAVKPQWVVESEGQRFLRQPLGRILADEWLGIAPPRPWAVHGGAATAIAAESEVLANVYRDEGVPSAKISMTGSFSMDHLRRCLARRTEGRQKLAREIGAKPEDPLVLCAFPPDFLPGRDDLEFESYLEMIRFWVAAVRAVLPNAVFQCHPVIPTPMRNEIARIVGRLTSEDIVELVASCDVLVTSVSSIIRFAVAAGFPVVNYDVYKFRYRDYRDASRVFHAETKAEFEVALRRALEHVRQRSSRDWSEEMASSSWGRLDGLGGQRILELISRLAR